MRRFAAAGIPAAAVADTPGFERRSRWYHPGPVSRGRPPAEDLADYLRTSVADPAVLIPCSDAWVLRVAGLPADVRARFPASLSAPAVLEQLLDKWGLAGLLAAAQVPHPKTVVLDSPADLARVPEDLLRASFLKPRDSLRFFARYGVKAFWVRTREEALARLAETTAAGLAVQLQEYVPGPADNHYFVDGFMDRDGAVPALFARRRLRMYPPDFGNSTLLLSVPLTEAAGAVDGVTRLLAHVGYRGIFSAEFKRDARDGEFKLLEVNVRPWWYVEFAGRCGVDVCLLAYQDALGERVAPVRSYAVGKACVYPYYDYYACRALRREGRLSVAAWAASWLTAMQPVFRWSDPRPALGEVARILWSRLSRVARRERAA